MPSRRTVVRCPSCGKKNAVDRDRAAVSRPRCAHCRTLLDIPAEQHAPMVVGDADFERLVERSPLPVLVEFWSPYCLYCQQLAPTIERLARTDSSRLRIATLNLDEHHRTPARFGVSATPTLLVLDGGREIDRIQGAMTEDQLRYRLFRYLN